ncbi:hypothetical protein GALMADRAFT_136947 [Galerina marginata CBS 339.88]|uniref:Uncharacterized protein n=1 Tax=Galerina marginata (strain CBS 339.88) TaxID=685588 RepID=A0A067TDS8_GALM3|nr:hypothetical protein GALMADRAFT_136947 [Galerina marginata CBS 339.88]
MVKFSTAFFFAVTLAGAVPAFAEDMPINIEARSLDAISEDPILSRQLIEAVYGRELTENELQEREPFFGLIFAAARIGAQIASRVGSKVAGKLGRKAAHHAVDHHNNHNNHRHRRSLDDELELDSRAEFEDLLERDFYDGEIIDERGIDDFDELD